MHDKTEKVVLCQPSGPTTVTGRSGNFFSATTCHCRPQTNCCGDAKSERSSGSILFTSAQAGNSFATTQSCNATHTGSSLCRAEIRNESPEVSTGRERLSSNLAIQSSPDCTGTKSASSELPVETESNGSEWPAGSLGACTVYMAMMECVKGHQHSHDPFLACV